MIYQRLLRIYWAYWWGGDSFVKRVIDDVCWTHDLFNTFSSLCYYCSQLSVCYIASLHCKLQFVTLRLSVVILEFSVVISGFSSTFPHQFILQIDDHFPLRVFLLFLMPSISPDYAKYEYSLLHFWIIKLLWRQFNANIIDNSSHLRYGFVIKAMTDFKLSLFSRCVRPILAYE